MTRLLSGFFLVFMSCSAHAQTAAADAPLPETNVIGIVIFVVLFVGMCVGFFWYMWWNEKKKRQREEEH